MIPNFMAADRNPSDLVKAEGGEGPATDEPPISRGFGVQPLVSGQDLDVVLVAGKVAGSELPPSVPALPVEANRSIFRWVFEAPTAESIKVVAGSDFDAGAGDQFVTAPTPSAAPVDTGSLPVDLSAPSTTTVPAPSVGLDEPVAAPALEPQDLAPSVPEVEAAVAVGSTGAAERTIGFVLLALAAAMAAWAHLSNEQSSTLGLGRFRTAVAEGAVPVAARAGAAAAARPTVGGLSRFARERTTPPSRLA
jgi:hypothetical protein